MPNKLNKHFLNIIENKKNFIYNEAGLDTGILDQSYKTLVVRHPFERILSAYLYFFHKIKGESWIFRECQKEVEFLLLSTSK